MTQPDTSMGAPITREEYEKGVESTERSGIILATILCKV
jgi:hypothetical protein